MNENIINIVLDKLKEKYMKDNFYIEKCIVTDDIEIVLNNKKLYYSDEYSLTVLDLTEKYLWENKIYNVIFTYSEIYSIPVSVNKINTFELENSLSNEITSSDYPRNCANDYQRVQFTVGNNIEMMPNENTNKAA